MFGRKRTKEKSAPPPFDPRPRVTLYAMGGLYLGYLLYQMAVPYFKKTPSAPSTPLFLLGVAVLGGGMVLLLYLAWRMYRMPVPVEEDPEDPALSDETSDQNKEDAENGVPEAPEEDRA